MKALLVYPKFPLSFWSFSNVTKYSSVKALFYPLGLLTVASLLPRNWQVRLVDQNVRELTESDWNWADMIMLSGMHAQRKGLLSLVHEAKNKNKLVISGGSYSTLQPDELIQAGCDYVVSGEAENCMDQLFKAITEGQSGTIIRNDLKPDLARSPVPRFDLVEMSHYRNFLLQTTRGCPFNCEFCDIASLYGNTPRYKTADQVIREIDQLYQAGARGCIFLADDNFIANRENAKVICQEIIQWNRLHHQPFGFTTQASVNLGQDLEMIDLMTAANFGEIFIGIETPDEKTLMASQKFQNVKNPLLESLNTIKKNGLSITGSFIIGFDNEKKGAGKRICDFVEQADIPIIMPNILCAPPGTQLWKRLEKEERLLSDEAAEHPGEANLSLPNFIPTRPLEEIVEEYVGIWEFLYHTPRFFERTYNYCLAVRPTRRAMAAARGEKEPQHSAQAVRQPLQTQLNDIRLFLHHVWLYGILSPYRKQFWKQLGGMRRQNPSRLRKYIIHCIQGEELMRLSKTIRQTMYQLLEEKKEKEKTRPPSVSKKY